MILVKVEQAQANFPQLLADVARGETVVVSNETGPIAEIRGVERPTGPRPVGLAKGSFSVPASLFEPLPDDVVEAFEGGK